MSNAASTARLYRNIALIEFTDTATMAEVTGGPLARYIVRQLSDAVVAIDHAHFETVLRALRKSGYTPRVIASAAGEERL